MDLRGPLIGAHVLGAIAFFVVHSVSAYSLIRLRGERDRDRIRRLLDRSARSQNLLGVFLLIFFGAGLAVSFMGVNWWTSGRLWLWVSLALFILTMIAMSTLGAGYMNRIRVAVGRPSTHGKAPEPGAMPPEADDRTLEAALTSPRGLSTAVIGITSLVVITWLMVAKPF